MGRNYKKSNGEYERIVQRGHIIGLHTAGFCKVAVARYLGINIKTVNRWIDRYKIQGNVFRKASGAPPRKTVMEEDRAIIELSNSNPMLSAAEIARRLNVPCSVNTVRRRLCEASKISYYTSDNHTLCSKRKSQNSWQIYKNLGDECLNSNSSSKSEKEQLIDEKQSGACSGNDEEEGIIHVKMEFLEKTDGPVSLMEEDPLCITNGMSNIYENNKEIPKLPADEIENNYPIMDTHLSRSGFSQAARKAIL